MNDSVNKKCMADKHLNILHCLEHWCRHPTLHALACGGHTGKEAMIIVQMG